MQSNTIFINSSTAKDGKINKQINHNSVVILTHFSSRDADNLPAQKLNFAVSENASLRIFELNLSENKQTKVDIKIELVGDGATSDYRALNILSSCDNNFDYRVTHIGRNTKSSLNVNSFLMGSTRNSNLAIRFEEGCIGAKGVEQDNCQILDAQNDQYSLSRNIVCPIIESFEEDADGTHNMTCGHIDEQKIQYLQSRGMSLSQIKMLMFADSLELFLNEIKAADEAVYEKLLEVEDVKKYRQQ